MLCFFLQYVLFVPDAILHPALAVQTQAKLPLHLDSFARILYILCFCVLFVGILIFLDDIFDGTFELL